jgi:Galactose oxidase, central domain
VLVTGGENGSSALSSAELYDPAMGTWTATGNLASARAFHSATLLPSGKVLAAGGTTDGITSLSSAELYDRGLGFDPSWQPLLTTVSPSILHSGSELTASGSRFKGISEASGGNGAQNSSSNYPLIQLLSLANEQTFFLPVDAMTAWSNTSFTSTPITLMTTSSSGFPIGHALVTVFINGIPSQSQFVVAVPEKLGSTHRPTPTPRPRPTPPPRPTP